MDHKLPKDVAAPCYKLPKDVAVPCYKMWVTAVVAMDAIQTTRTVTTTHIRVFLFCV
jgi:hypothetical protein